jgi:hypothetical protein
MVTVLVGTVLDRVQTFSAMIYGRARITANILRLIVQRVQVILSKTQVAVAIAVRLYLLVITNTRSRLAASVERVSFQTLQ